MPFVAWPMSDSLCEKTKPRLWFFQSRNLSARRAGTPPLSTVEARASRTGDHEHYLDSTRRRLRLVRSRCISPAHTVNDRAAFAGSWFGQTWVRLPQMFQNSLDYTQQRPSDHSDERVKLPFREFECNLHVRNY